MRLSERVVCGSAVGSQQQRPNQAGSPGASSGAASRFCQRIRYNRCVTGWVPTPPFGTGSHGAGTWRAGLHPAPASVQTSAQAPPFAQSKGRGRTRDQGRVARSSQSAAPSAAEGSSEQQQQTGPSTAPAEGTSHVFVNRGRYGQFTSPAGVTVNVTKHVKPQVLLYRRL